MLLNQGWIYDRPGIDKYIAQVGSLNEYGLFSTEQKDVSLWLPLLQCKPNWIRGAQGIGDCVAWGVELPCTVLLAIQDRLGVSEWIEEVATESIYGLSRVEVYGKKTAGYSDGATGYGGAMAVHKFGALLRQDYSLITNNAEHNLTKYDAKKAKAWGNFGCGGQNDKNALDEVAKKYPVKSVTSIQTIEEALSALYNGYPISCASMAGFGNMQRNKDGIVRMSGQWAHQMCVLGVRWMNGKPLFRLFQSWGNSCGTENDPGIDFPNISKCSWWITEGDLNWILKNGEVYTYSEVDGFPARKLKFKEATDLWG